MVSTHTTPKKRTRRTPEQMIADKETEIAMIKERAARKAAKQTPEGKAFVAARGAVSRALKAALEAEDDAMAEALRGALDALEEHAEAAGLAAARKGPKAA